MAMLTEFAHELGANQSGTTDYNDFHNLSFYVLIEARSQLPSFATTGQPMHS
jgi:hypothetical protein